MQMFEEEQCQCILVKGFCRQTKKKKGRNWFLLATGYMFLLSSWHTTNSADDYLSTEVSTTLLFLAQFYDVFT